MIYIIFILIVVLFLYLYKLSRRDSKIKLLFKIYINLLVIFFFISTFYHFIYIKYILKPNSEIVLYFAKNFYQVKDFDILKIYKIDNFFLVKLVYFKRKEFCTSEFKMLYLDNRWIAKKGAFIKCSKIEHI